ncbi:MAG: DNA processing protein DprA [Coriobacteriaceae bacterium]|nr:DNA processing protein DprA [Coriobacteriaceae bacterium]
MIPPGAWQLLRGDSGYPECLERTPRPPAVLYGVGDPGLLVPGLGVVGARKATPYGLACARRFAGWAAAAGVVIVSGAAIGCDLEAHTAALDADGSSVAVLGCGADVDYPACASKVLASLRRCGAVVSEMPWGSPPHRRAFVPRNRIIAGLSAAVLIVEARLPSGTFTTADLAADAGREVLAVPGSIHAPESLGPNRLIRQGATSITDISELADELRALGIAVEPPGAPGRIPSGRDPLLRALRADPMRVDDLARTFDLDIVTATRRIAALEQAGEVVRYPDARYGVPVRETQRRYNQSVGEENPRVP